ncbi:hypothetical protein AB0D40_26840 [Streptomyces massasporeus]|uniref:hypothetical protein n=1 Tax=Streptomyces massasporeus TaxID=67324 RepID=UPI0033D88211
MSRARGRRRGRQPGRVETKSPGRTGLAVEAHAHHRAFLSALADEAERIPRARPCELLQP